MNASVLVFLLLNAIGILALPRNWAALPLLIGACYMTLGQGFEIGPFSFTVIRILIGAGLVRLVVRGERLAGGLNGLDKLMMLWAFWAVASVPLLNNLAGEFDAGQEYIFRLGLVYNTCGLYFLLRAFCHTIADVVGLCQMTAILLAPLALEMLVEMMIGANLFSAFGGVPAVAEMREGRFRAQGPFAHAILAGTVGAVSLPMLVCLWRLHRNYAIVGSIACVTMVVACASSGPIMSLMSAVAALWMWKHRDKMQLVRRLAVAGYIVLNFTMKAPAYYILARMDIVGGSTGWHRAALIEASIQHFNEWWLGGTNFTRDWLPTGVSWSPNHTDITNHYLHLGVIGGMPLVLIFLATLVKGFSFVGQTLRDRTDLTVESQFMVWALGASLFVHSMTCISVAYFDQSFVFIYLTLGAIGSMYSALRNVEAREGSELELCEEPVSDMPAWR